MRDLGSGVFLQLILMDGDELQAHGGASFLHIMNSQHSWGLSAALATVPCLLVHGRKKHPLRGATAKSETLPIRIRHNLWIPRGKERWRSWGM